MKTYSIGEVAKIMGFTTHTLRYYDKEGLLTVRKNSAGLRRFNEEDLAWLHILSCLKATGLPLKEIRHYLNLSRQGNKTLQERMTIFQKQKQRLEEQINILKQNMEKIDFKIKYYEAAMQDGEKDVFIKHPELKKQGDKLFKKQA